MPLNRKRIDLDPDFNFDDVRPLLVWPHEVAKRWYDDVYLPGVTALRGEELPADHAYKTEADLFLCIYGKRRDLLVEDPAVDFAAAARKARGSRVSRRFKRELLREKRTPLRRKPRPRASRDG